MTSPRTGSCNRNESPNLDWLTSLLPDRSLPLALILVLMALVITGAACVNGRNQTPTVTWKLSTEAQSSYFFLVLEEAIRSRNVNIADLTIKEILAQNPGPEFYVEAANYYWQAGRLEPAQEILQSGLARYPKESELLLLLAQVHLANKDLLKAIALLEEYLASHAHDYQTYQDLAAVYIKHKLYDKALALLASLPTTEHKPHTLVLIAKAKAGLNKLAEAVVFLRRAIKTDPKFIEAWMELTSVYEISKDYTNAERTYQKLIKLDNSNAELLFRFIEVNLKLRNTTKALKLASHGPTEPSFITAVATALIERGLYNQASRYLKSLLEKKEQPELYFFLAIIAYEDRKNLTASAKLLKNIPEENHLYKHALQLRIQLLLEDGKSDKALELARTAREKYLEHKEYWILEAKVYKDRKDLEKAIFVLKNALDIWNDDPEIMFELGTLYENVKQFEAALALMECIIALDPEHAEALNFVGYTLAILGKDLERAFTLITKAHKLKPENGYIRDSLAWVLFQRGEMTKAWEEICKAVDQANNDPTIWEHYGDIARAVGHPGKAAKAWRRALKLKSINTDTKRIRGKLVQP
ncbi:putative TPR_REGION domain-containing protein [Desulfovibrionales bacterium]